MNAARENDGLGRLKRIEEYVRRRLRAEVAANPHGYGKSLAKKLGVSGPHLSNIISEPPTRNPGQDVLWGAAAHWGLTFAEMEALALGEDVGVARSQSVHALLREAARHNGISDGFVDGFLSAVVEKNAPFRDLYQQLLDAWDSKRGPVRPIALLPQSSADAKDARADRQAKVGRAASAAQKINRMRARKAQSNK